MCINLFWAQVTDSSFSVYINISLAFFMTIPRNHFLVVHMLQIQIVGQREMGDENQRKGIELGKIKETNQTYDGKAWTGTQVSCFQQKI